MLAAIMHTYPHSRAILSSRADITTDFDSNYYYRFSNALQPNRTISSGIDKSSNGAISMTAFTTLSSENWQLYYQGGRYFIRNYDYLGTMQLGLTADSRTEPKLMARSGALAQQWSVVKSSDGKGYMLTNGLLGNGSFLSLSGDNLVPAMSPSMSGAVWDIQVNPSAGSPKDAKMYQDNADFEIATSSTSSASSTATLSGTPISSTSAPSSSGSIQSSAPDSSSFAKASSSGISTGGIVGAVVGGVAVLVMAGLIIFFVLRARKRKGNKIRPGEPGLVEAPSSDKLVYSHGSEGASAELADQSMVFEAQQKGYDVVRHEMDGQGGYSKR